MSNTSTNGPEDLYNETNMSRVKSISLNLITSVALVALIELNLQFALLVVGSILIEKKFGKE